MDTFQEYQVSKLVAYVTFDGAERVQSLKEWKTGYSDYYGESDETTKQRCKKGETTPPSARCNMGCLRDRLCVVVRDISPVGALLLLTFVRGNAHKKFLKDQKRAGYSFYLLDPGAPPRSPSMHSLAKMFLLHVSIMCKIYRIYT